MDIEKSYNNAYQLLIGETTYNKLAKQKEFYLPTDHDDVSKLLHCLNQVTKIKSGTNLISSISLLLATSILKIISSSLGLYKRAFSKYKIDLAKLSSL